VKNSAMSKIPTNIITGFLGAGKTTSILHLLKQKPKNERWAILVNEFGEIGIDGSLFEAASSEQREVFIREVPGGCMCCTAGLSMEIALNRLISHSQPHRLLIEPTGLGHPKEVLSILNAPHYRDIIDLQKTLTIVDARKCTKKKYLENSTFIDQLEVADTIVANKSDLYKNSEFSKLINFLETENFLESKTLHQVSMGKISPHWLEGKTTTAKKTTTGDTSPLSQGNVPTSTIISNQEMPECGYLSSSNSGPGFHSQGWVFSPHLIFDQNKLYNLMLDIDAERLKGVFITEQGITAYNKSDDLLSELILDDALDSRIEIISTQPIASKSIEAELLNCLGTTELQEPKLA